MIVLGLNCFHSDASAALLIDGRLVAAAEEERFRRIKHWAGFPSESIRYCLSESGLQVCDIDIIAINQDSSANLSAKMKYLLNSWPGFTYLAERLRNRGARENAVDLVQRLFPGSRIRAKTENVEHHLAHLSSAFHVSPFDQAVIASVDGFGDFASAAWGVGDGARIDVEGRVLFPHSLGIFYQALTQYLGFPRYGDEYKVMGLAPYGERRYMREMGEIVRLKDDGTFLLNLDYFKHHKEQISFEWQGGTPAFDELFTPALEQLLGPRRKEGESLESRHHDIARSTQAMYEEAFFNLLNSVYARHSTENICLAGGCAMNSVANGKIRRVTGFQRVYVQSAAGDAGGAIGAAFAVWHKNGGRRTFVMDHAYWGPQFNQNYIEGLLKNEMERIGKANCIVRLFADEPTLCQKTAEAVSQGNVVGWFQGRLEWGPRALGNRSIVCDPRRSDMKDILNAKIKRRESFRPFAPSIMAEAVKEWFEEDDDVPFMMQVFQIREEKRASIPAVTHVDGSGRLQTVSHETNPRYYNLIRAFFDITGVPLVLNTSFNENEPVVCKPEEALDCFLRTNMDVIVLGNVMITRASGTESTEPKQSG